MPKGHSHMQEIGQAVYQYPLSCFAVVHQSVEADIVSHVRCFHLVGALKAQKCPL
jgi:hypothetical protein